MIYLICVGAETPGLGVDHLEVARVDLLEPAEIEENPPHCQVCEKMI